MTPERAAEVLGVAPGAEPREVERAFARLARETHPDRFASRDDAAQSRERSERFAEVALARETLLVVAARRRAAAERVEADLGVGTGASTIVRPPSRNLLLTWIGVLGIAGFLATAGPQQPLGLAESVVRWALLIAAFAVFGWTGRRAALVVGLVILAATVVITVVLASFGGLLGLLVAVPGLYGLSLMGVATRPRTRPVDN